MATMFPYRPNGPLMCDLQGRFTATFKTAKGKKKVRDIYVYNARNRGRGLGIRDQAKFSYWLYNSGGSLGEVIKSCSYKKLLELIDPANRPKKKKTTKKKAAKRKKK